jgi:adenosylcobinamide-GDP ribazoletransferase
MGNHTLSGLRAAIGLLTRLPMGQVGEADLAKAVGWIPFVGGVIGLVIALAYILALQVLPSLPAAGFAVTLGVLVTGAFHEDGLADVADGFGGSSDREEVIRIMRDPAHGTYGVMALVASFVLKVGALATLGVGGALVILPVVHALSRGASIGVMATLPAASPAGVGAAVANLGKGGRATLGILVAIGIGLLTLGWWTMAFAALAAIGAVSIGRLARNRIEGFTGDVLGAVEQIDEVMLLLVGAALAWTGVVAGAWWT